MKKLWMTKASYKLDQALPYVQGEFKIPILRVGPSGEKLLPAPKKPPSGKRKGPEPKPFLELKTRGRQLRAAAIAKGQDKHALMQAASSKIGKFNKDVAHVQRLHPDIRIYPDHFGNQKPLPQIRIFGFRIFFFPVKA